MKGLTFIFILFQFKSLSAQTIQQIDSVSIKMCESLSRLNEIKDDVKITMIFQKHLPDFYEKVNISSQTIADSIRDIVYFRLQKNCKDFRDVLGKIEENKSDWITLLQKPKSKISKKQFSNFLKGGNFYYKEYDGKIVNVFISKNIWMEKFEDGTTSKLLIHAKYDGEFDLEFVESDNHIRKNLSIKGDLYNYGLCELNRGVFDVWVSQSDKTIYGFRIYSKD
ncbi:hypothetical protein [Flavobacterium sp. FlaQc-50]|jgi:hypothetical protein|uniref:hypothetical protein n=1 Tax=unclassified Flavobacterium TaxID=196869 RepID=UPI003758485E